MTRVALVLASASPARLETLRRAGVEPRVLVSGVDESAVGEPVPARLAERLAVLKRDAVVARVPRAAEGSRTLVLGCDSVLAVDGVAYGKPHDAADATERLRSLRGRSAVLCTGHAVADVESGRRLAATAVTTVRFGDFDDEEIAAYVATGEPLHVAGAFTIDGLGGAFVDGVEGDPWNVVGLSLPLLRSMLGELGVAWYDLWAAGEPRR